MRFESDSRRISVKFGDPKIKHVDGRYAILGLKPRWFRAEVNPDLQFDYVAAKLNDAGTGYCYTTTARTFETMEPIKRNFELITKGSDRPFIITLKSRSSKGHILTHKIKAKTNCLSDLMAMVDKLLVHKNVYLVGMDSESDLNGYIPSRARAKLVLPAKMVDYVYALMKEHSYVYALNEIYEIQEEVMINADPNFIKFLKGDDQTHELQVLSMIRSKGKTLPLMTNVKPREMVLDCLVQHQIIPELMNVVDDDVQLLVVKQNPTAIQYIENPCEAVQLEAVRHHMALFMIKNPTMAARKLSIETHIATVKAIEHTTLEEEMFVMSRSHTSFPYIQNPHDETIKMALVSYPNNIRILKNPTVEHYGIAITNQPESFKDTIAAKNPNENMEVCRMAIRATARNISHIKSPCEELQLLAWEQVESRYRENIVNWIGSGNVCEALQVRIAQNSNYHKMMSNIWYPKRSAQREFIKHAKASDLTFLREPFVEIQRAVVRNKMSDFEYLRAIHDNVAKEIYHDIEDLDTARKLYKMTTCNQVKVFLKMKFGDKVE